MEPSIIVALIAAAASVATAVIGLAQRRHVADVRRQVTNTHPTNLRDDIDAVLSKLDDLADGQHRHDAEISGLRRDLRDERRERMALTERLNNERRQS